MDVILLRQFQIQVRDQCKFALASGHGIAVALDELEQARQAYDNTRRNEANDALWYYIQNMVVATANISKALWGASGKLEQERADLRASIGVDDSSPFKPTDMRNHFEHYDERLDRWHRESVRHWFLDRNLGPLDRFITPPPDRRDVFRHYDPTTGVVTFWGDEFNIPVILAEIERVGPIVEAEAAKPPSS